MDTTLLLKRNVGLPLVSRLLRQAHNPPNNARAYRRALRAAEQASWDASKPSEKVLRSTTAGDNASSTFFALIGFACLAALTFAFDDGPRFANHWEEFVSVLRHFIG